MKLIALAVVILALGIVLGFAIPGGSSGGPASAVPQCPGPSSQCPTPTATATATPTATPTPTPALATIQFVDDSIEAFNQTVVQPIAAAVTQLQADVSDLDQRVAALEMPQGRLIELGTQTVGVDERYESALVDISDCGQETVMATASIAANSIQLGSYFVSPDGVTRIEHNLSGNVSVSTGGQATATHEISLPFPFMSVVVTKAATQAVVDITAWIWCEP